MNQKEKDILKANPVLEKPGFAEQLRQWKLREQEKTNELQHSVQQEKRSK